MCESRIARYRYHQVQVQYLYYRCVNCVERFDFGFCEMWNLIVIVRLVLHVSMCLCVYVSTRYMSMCLCVYVSMCLPVCAYR